jgi:outer membrane receptor for ferrienterochelin and colicin
MSYIFFFILCTISLFSESIVHIEKIQPLGDSNPGFEESIKTNLKKEKVPFSFQFGQIEKSPEFISEIYYLWNKNLPPDIYIATFHPDTKYLIDLIAEKSILELPKEIEIVKAEFQEREEEIIKRALKKYSISLSLNKPKAVLRENITENLQNKKLRDILSPRIKTESIEKKSDDAFSYLKEQFDTATRTTQKVEDLPITVSVINKKEIRDYNYRTLVEALKFKPGIMVSEPGNGEIGNHFFQRGLLGNAYSKILLNGIPISPSVTFGMPINEMLYLKHAESIEVVYGPASAVYGADAFAGVINIKTVPKKENNLRMETHLGEFGYLNHNFSVTNKVPLADDYLTLSVYGLKSNRKDQNIKNGYSDVYYAEKYYQRNGQFGDRINFFSELPSSNESYGTSLTFKKFSFLFDNMKRSDQSSIGQQSSYYNYNNSGAVWGDNITRFAAKNSIEMGKLTFNTNVSYNQYRLDTNSNYNLKFEKTPLYKFMGSNDMLFEQTSIYKPTKQIEVLLGFSYQFSGVFPKTNDLKLPFNPNFYQPFSDKKPLPDPDFGYFGYNPQRFQNSAGFFQVSYSIDNISIIAGARHDTHSLYGSADNPRIALLQKVNSVTSLRLSYTEGFRGAPLYLSTNSIAIGTASSGVTYLFVPNENLRPEKLRSYEFGIRYLLSNIISLETVFFHNFVDNKFNVTRVDRNEILYPNSKQKKVDTFANVGKNNLNGLDIIIGFQELHKPTHLNISLSTSISKGSEYLAPENDSTKSDLEIAILELYDNKRNKIQNFRGMPNRMSKIRVSMKFFEMWFLALDYINSDGWYSRNIISKRQYDIAEYNINYDPYFANNKIKGYSIIDFNTHIDFLKYFRIMAKVTNMTNQVFSGQAAYDGSQNLDINPQYRRNCYLGLEVNHSW